MSRSQNRVLLSSTIHTQRDTTMLNHDAACQIMSELKHWEYFDKCSPLQCAKHLFANDFRPVDL